MVSASDGDMRIAPGVWACGAGQGGEGGEGAADGACYRIIEPLDPALRARVIGWHEHHIQPVLAIADRPDGGVELRAGAVGEAEPAEVLLRSGPLDWQAACCFLRHAARACAAAGARGIEVTALSPAQLLITAYGRALVRGLGWWPDDPSWAAVDQPPGPASTSYALGCLGYGLLGGQPPFIGLAGETLREAHRDEPPLSLQRVAPGVPVAVTALIEACLAKDPAARPADAAAVVAAIDELRPAGRSVPDGVPGLVGSDEGEAEALVAVDDAGGRPFQLAGATVVAAATTGSARTLRALTTPSQRREAAFPRRRGWRTMLLLAAFLLGMLVGAAVVLGEIARRHANRPAPDSAAIPSADDAEAAPAAPEMP